MNKISSFFCLKIVVVVCMFYVSSCKKSNDNNSETTTQIPVEPDSGVFFKRSTLLVSDADQSLQIYRDILGFTISSSKESGKNSYSYPVFKIPQEAIIKFVVLNSAHQDRTLALTEVKGVELPKPSNPYMSAIVIRVDGLATMMQKIKKLGLETTEIKVVEKKRINFREQAFIDYDGHLIVLYETF